ncbi:UNVERIFIED_CONTAM: hypothetical protein RMT77_014715 [Armadillidium vulgare]
MNFLIIILCFIFLNKYVRSELKKCFYEGDTYIKHLIFFFGMDCTTNSCDWTDETSNCKIGTTSRVLKWETDIFEIGFEPPQFKRPKEVVIKINLTKDYYIKVEVISDKENKTVTVILKECSHKKNCSQMEKKTHTNITITNDFTYVGIGFRKDKKINFAAVSKNRDLATNLFSPDNVYEFKTPDFSFNTNETKNITVYSPFDKNFDYDGILMYLPTSVGGHFFNRHGYLIHDNNWCRYFYNNPKETEGLPYIIKEYFGNSENWKAPPVNYTPLAGIPYFGLNGMKFKSEQMFLKEGKNPNFDENQMTRKGCKYVAKTRKKRQTNDIMKIGRED